MFKLGLLGRIIIIVFIICLAFLLVSNYHWCQKIFYPVPYFEIVQEESEKYGLDPFLIMAMIRVESKFNEKAESTKGALGLMQIMPETAKWIAQEMKIDDYNSEILLEVHSNISFGTWYFNHLSRQFNGKLVVALAAYNAGQTKVRQWINSGTWSGEYKDYQNIPYPETQNYLQRIIKDYQIYKKLYNSKRN